MNQSKSDKRAHLEGRQPLLVPYEKRDQARQLNARWHANHRTWTIDPSQIEQAPRTMLPLRDRPGLEPPYLRINLVPQTSWGRNIRALITPEQWAQIRRDHVYPSTGYLCLVCGGRGSQWPVEADEVWKYDDKAGVQTLAVIVPLCPDCHLVRSAGNAVATGRTEEAIHHLSWVERITSEQADERIRSALNVWRRRSRREWQIDVSVMAKYYGIQISHEADQTDAINRKLIREATRRARRGE